METNKEKSLPRRVQSLQRFLLERLRSELAQRKSQAPPEPLLANVTLSANASSEPKQATAAPGNATERQLVGDGGGSGGPAPDQAPGEGDGSREEGREVDGGVGDVDKARGNEVDLPGGEGNQANDFPAPEEMAAGLDGLFGVLMQQRIRCLYGEKAEKTQDILSFQVLLSDFFVPAS